MVKSTPSPNIPILIFVLYTICYFVVMFYIDFAKNNPTASFFIYVCLLLVIQFGNNSQVLYSTCGHIPYGAVIKVTLLPWILIFYCLNFLLTIFPGWLLPFSNTFGYGLATLAGLKDTLNGLLKSDIPTKNKEDKDLSNILGRIYADRSLLINEVIPDTVDNFIDKMRKGNLLRSYTDGKQDELINQLRRLVLLKELTAKAIWYILAGMLTISVSYNLIINSQCSKSVDDMKKRHKEYEDALEAEEKISQPEKRVYYNDE